MSSFAGPTGVLHFFYMIKHPDQRVGIFIDTQNMYYSARFTFGKKVNFGNIVKDAVGERKLIRAVAYVVKTKTAEETPFFEALEKLGIELREKDLMEYFSGQKKADWDVGLTVDVIRMLDMLDVVVLVSGDGDYLPLVEYIKNRGRIVEVIAFRETTSTRLFDAADNYVNLSDDPKRYLIAAGKTDKDEILSKEDSFMPQNKTDHEEKRKRRLSF